MFVTGYFTLPVGQKPEEAAPNICVFPDKVQRSLQSSDPCGAYQLYRCDTPDGVIAENVVPVCRVQKPLLLYTPRVYLDTSAISYLSQEDSPKEMEITQRFWDAAKEMSFLIQLSDITLGELYRCPEPKRSQLFDFLQQVHYNRFEAYACPGVDDIVKRIVDLGIFPKRSGADILHVAVALYAQSDVIASWDVKHLANRDTVERIRSLVIGQYNSHVDILTPEKIMEVYL